MDTTYLTQYENTADHWNIYSFSGGPTQLPRYVGHNIYNEFLSHRDTGMSILETPARGKEFH
jgi:phosphoserine aminotransferase